MQLRFFWIIALLLTAQSLCAQDVVLKAEIDRDSIMIGEQVQWSLKATVDKQLPTAFPSIDSVNNGLIEILSARLDTLQETASNITVQANWTITSFDAGIYPLPRVPFLVRRTNGQVDTLYSEQDLQLKVKTVAIDTTTFEAFDIKAPIKYPVTLEEILFYVGIGLAVLVIIVLIVYLMSKWKRKESIFFKSKPKDPPYVTALRELEKIKAEKLWQNNKVKIYYTRITDVLRVYLEEQYNVQAMEQTSEEILQSLQTLKIPEELMNKLRELLNVADLVKFAKYQPEQNENEGAISIVSDFVYNTRPKRVTGENK